MRNSAAVLMIDIQERLANAIKSRSDKKLREYEEFFKRSKILLKSAQILNINVVQSLQYVKGLGEQVDGLLDSPPNFSFEKRRFSAARECLAIEEISNTKNIIIFGMEAHVCVLQSALELSKFGHNIYVVSDCVMSRNNKDAKSGLRLLETYENIKVVCLESLLFMLLETSKADEFKQISSMIKTL